jgi:nicotinamidase/pyrazinamidase
MSVTTPPELPPPQALVPGPGDALLVVDVQHDFLPGGALGVRGGDAILGPINAAIARFAARGAPVLASRDWHPAGHCSFREQGGPWPVHCVAGSHGAAFSPALHLPPGTVVVSKATERDQEAYSAFAGTGLHKHLQALGVRRLFIVGLATDYCVLHTARDALALGYRVVVLRDAVAAVDAQPGDGAHALAEMGRAGAAVAESARLASPAPNGP